MSQNVKNHTRSTLAAIMPTRRDLSFDLPAERIGDWCQNSVHLSQFFNTLSILFPVGERFFIDTVRHYRDQITDPELKKAVTAFIGQEAMHGREHEEYNNLTFARTPVSAQIETFTYQLLERAKKVLPKSMCLSGTLALEHFTALMADSLLNEPRLFENTDPHFSKIWHWHALEETEHKSVAFDVWDHVMGRGTKAYINRASGLVIATTILLAVYIPSYLLVLQQEGQLTNARGWRFLGQKLITKIPFFPRMIKPYLDYFRPDFHPWDHDNRQFLKHIDTYLNELPQAA